MTLAALGGFGGYALGQLAAGDEVAHVRQVGQPEQAEQPDQPAGGLPRFEDGEDLDDEDGDGEGGDDEHGEEDRT